MFVCFFVYVLLNKFMTNRPGAFSSFCIANNVLFENVFFVSVRKKSVMSVWFSSGNVGHVPYNDASILLF